VPNSSDLSFPFNCSQTAEIASYLHGRRGEGIDAEVLNRANIALGLNGLHLPIVCMASVESLMQRSGHVPLERGKVEILEVSTLQASRLMLPRTNQEGRSTANLSREFHDL